MNRRDLAPELGKRFDPMQIGRWCPLSIVGGRGWLQEGRVKCISRYKWNRK